MRMHTVMCPAPYGAGPCTCADTDWASNGWKRYAGACARKANVEKLTISVDQFAELLGLEPQRFVGITQCGRTLYIIMEPEMQTTGTMPQIHGNATYGKGKGSAKTPKGGGKKKC